MLPFTAVDGGRYRWIDGRFILGTAAAAFHCLATPGPRRGRQRRAGLDRRQRRRQQLHAGAVSRLPQLDQADLGDDVAACRPCSATRRRFAQIREHADRLGIKLQLAFGSVCPSSRSFNAQNGTLEEQVGRALKASQIFGATCMRCVLGGDPERPQIEMHIDNMIKAVRGIRSRIVDSGVKLAVENHGGDLQSREMKMMIEAVGADVMGVCLDSGNPVWMLEDPHMTLEMLIPYAATCHVRDSAVWKVPEGIAVRWVNMGDGNVDIDGWIRKFIAGEAGAADHLREPRLGKSARSRDLQPAVLGQLAKDAGVGVQPVPRGRRQGHAEAGDARARRARPPASSGSTISRSACATRAICCSGCEGVDGGDGVHGTRSTRRHGDTETNQFLVLAMRSPRESASVAGPTPALARRSRAHWNSRTRTLHESSSARVLDSSLNAETRRASPLDCRAEDQRNRSLGLARERSCDLRVSAKWRTRMGYETTCNLRASVPPC